jgi:hypothetical protein
MQLQNHTPFDVKIQIVEPRRERLACVIIKSTYDMDQRGGGRLSSEQLPLVTRYAPTPYGVFHNEIFFRKEGVDLCVLGTLKRRQSVPQASVHLFVGRASFGLAVRGDRVWRRDAAGQLRPSAPEPFREMVLGYERAFGGHRSFGDGSEVLYADNPSGRGYYLREEQAADQQLPNIEPLDGPTLDRWHAATPVAGWGPYPSFWGLRAKGAVELNDRQQIERVRPLLFNHAHPDLIFSSLETGQEIRVDGLKEDPLTLLVPAAPASVVVRVAGEEKRVPAPIDGVFLWCDDSKVVFTQRARFAYDVYPEEHRHVSVGLAVAEWG